MSVSEFLDVGAQELNELADEEPDTLATLQETIGTLYVVLSKYKEAEPLLDAALRISRRKKRSFARR